jgi:hypothetical protein
MTEGLIAVDWYTWNSVQRREFIILQRGYCDWNSKSLSWGLWTKREHDLQFREIVGNTKRNGRASGEEVLKRC